MLMMIFGQEIGIVVPLLELAQQSLTTLIDQFLAVLYLRLHRLQVVIVNTIANFQLKIVIVVIA